MTEKAERAQDPILAGLLDQAPEALGFPRERISPDIRLIDDLGASGIDWFEFIMYAQESLGIELADDELGSVDTLRQLADLIEFKQL